MLEMPRLDIGEKLAVQKVVREEDTALNYGSGKIEKLFATPKLVALMIEASASLLDKKLPEGYVTVGRICNVSHNAPTTMGQTVTVEVKIESVEDKKIILSMEAYDEIGKIGTGRHERYVVNKNELLINASKRAEVLDSKNF